MMHRALRVGRSGTILIDTNAVRLVILADRSFATRELALLSRLEIGLADEGIRVLHAIPAECIQPDSGGLYSTVVAYQARGLALTRRRRVAQLAESLHSTLGDENGPPVDAIHCFGAGAWKFGLELGGQLARPVVLEVDEAALVAHAASLCGHAAGATRPTICAPDPALVRAISGRLAAAEARFVPWGVHVGAARSALNPTAGVSAAVLAEHGAGRPLAAVLEALAQLSREFPGLLVFVAAVDGQEAAVWARARELGLLDRLSILSDMEARRDPILRADMLIMPDAGGRQHSLTLEAMAVGMTVAAAADPMVSCLIDGQTARIVTEPQAAVVWNAAIGGLLRDPAAALTLSESARAWVGRQRSVSAQVAAALQVYRQITPDRAEPVLA